MPAIDFCYFSSHNLLTSYSMALLIDDFPSSPQIVGGQPVVEQ
jgi:hypothetical protein